MTCDDGGTMPARARGTTAEERLERLLELQSLLARVAREIGPALELHGVLTTVLQAMRSLVQFRGGTIQLVDERGVYVAAADPAVTEDLLAARVPVGTGLSGRVISTGTTITSPDIRNDDRVDPAIRRLGSNAPTRSYLAVPLIVLSQVIGVLQVDSEEVDAFDSDDVALLEGLAVQVAGAIESARRREDLLEVERMKADFIARISHELRTPLTVMGGFTDTLLLHADRISAEQQHEVLGRIKTSVTRLSSLIEEILTVSSLDAGMTRVRPQDVEMRPLLEEVAHLSLDADRVTVVCDPDLHIVTDPVILRHLVNQLVDNALKYGGDAEVSCEVDADGPRIVVRDHGPGIPEADRVRVFDRFYRGNHTGAGMGLGLPVVRQLAASLDASVALDDAPGGGARFTLRFR
jgi:signal transduction histidine kinase